MRIRRATRLVLPAALALCLPAAGAIRPSFSVDRCAWEATHILVVTEGDRIDGDVTVLESWWGDLPKGAILHLPDLKAYATDFAREVHFLGDPPKDAPKLVTGARMVLFLKRDGERWLPAAKWGGLDVSVAWIEGGKAYARVQLINPGDAFITDLNMDEAAMKEKAVAVASARKAADATLAEIRAVRDAGDRAKRALDFAASTEHYPARLVAFEIVKACGEAATPHLCAALFDAARAAVRLDVIMALGVVGGPGAGEALTKLIDAEVRFWKENAPGLKPGWWNGGGIAWDRVEELRRHYGDAYEALNSLKKLRYERCKETVTEFELYWTSQPQLNNIGNGQMTEACEAVLRDLSLPNK